MKKSFIYFLYLIFSTSCMATFDNAASDRSLQNYHTALKSASTQDDLIKILATIANESHLLTAHKELSFPEDIPYSDTHPLTFEDTGYFVIGFDDDSLCFSITARNPDHYEVLSELQDKMVETDLATSGVHVVGEADERLFPSFKYYFDECKRLSMLSHTLAFDLKNNLTLLQRIHEHQIKAPSDHMKANVSPYVSFLTGIDDDCLYETYTKGFAQKLIQDYTLSLVENTSFTKDLDLILSVDLPNSVLDLYALMKGLAATHSELLTLNDYDTFTPKYVTTFKALEEGVNFPQEKRGFLSSLIEKINVLQNAFESRQESHQPTHDVLFKEIATSEQLVPLSVNGLMQCRSASLNHDVHRLMTSVFPHIKSSLVPVSDIENFIRFFHERGTILRTLERQYDTRTATLDLMDVHLILERRPLNNTQAKALGLSYRMLGQFQMGETVNGLHIQIYGMSPAQYAALNLLYQLTSSGYALTMEKHERMLEELETILISNTSVLLPLSFVTESEGSRDHSLSFDDTIKKLVISSKMMAAQKERLAHELSTFSAKEKHHYYVYDQGGRAYGVIDWFFY